ncbi:uncharacterized protein EI90DRAFT_589420 [Cantharellus anzutake]|uniref:uncharacterized protein n=1 Tax=Cantharellus anzutake TaxID=1750568 RepID=UPI001907BA26|nr:uncharacterized protein EI90DRAFT_589420 [Cantharellus anzutake]KAF8333641.1 hypothetical protein EI90DRAFT_589420 [Cantharellus anzutake]
MTPHHYPPALGIGRERDGRYVVPLIPQPYLTNWIYGQFASTSSCEGHQDRTNVAGYPNGRTSSVMKVKVLTQRTVVRRVNDLLPLGGAWAHPLVVRNLCQIQGYKILEQLANAAQPRYPNSQKPIKTFHPKNRSCVFSQTLGCQIFSRFHPAVGVKSGDEVQLPRI